MITKIGPLKAVVSTFICISLLTLAGCSESGSDVRNQIVTAENAAELAESSKQQLSYEEYELLQAYVRRVNPEVPEGELPAGITVGTMIESQRAFLEAQSQSGTAEEVPDQQSVAEAPRPAPRETLAADTPAAPKQPLKSAPATAEPSRLDEPTAQPEPPSAPKTVTVPAGTSINVRLAESLSSKSSSSGDSFETILDDDLEIDGNLLAPAGSRISGRVTNAVASGKVQGRAQMSITLSRIEVGEDVYALRTNTLSFEAEGSGKKDAKKIGIATGIGAVIGAIAGGGKGAAIGTAIGAGAGTGVVLATPGDEVEFSSEQLFNFRFEDSLEMAIFRQ